MSDLACEHGLTTRPPVCPLCADAILLSRDLWKRRWEDEARESNLLRARLADGELDTVRLLHLAKEPFFDEYGGVDLHEEASINASVFGRDEPNHNDYLAALRTAIDTAMGESRE